MVHGCDRGIWTLAEGYSAKKQRLHNKQCSPPYEMKKTTIFKRISAIVLLITFFLPLSQCEMKKVTVEETVVVSEVKENTIVEIQKKSPQGSDIKSGSGYNIPYKMFDPEELTSWLLLLAFLWPFPLLLYAHFGKRQRAINGLIFIEPIACLGSGYMAGIIAFMGDILYGGYLALGSIIIYFMASCFDIYVLIKQYIRSRKGEQGHAR